MSQLTAKLNYNPAVDDFDLFIRKKELGQFIFNRRI